MKKENKNNLRSFRYSDRVAEILEGFVGDSMNAKFENLVLFCFDALEDSKKDYEYYKRCADDERREWLGLHKRLDVINGMIEELQSMKNRLSDMADTIGQIEELCNTKKSPGVSGREGIS